MKQEIKYSNVTTSGSSHSSKSSNYGCFSFLLDLLMIGLTGGLWIIWIIIRELRKS